MMSLMSDASRLLGRGPHVDLVLPLGFLILYVAISTFEALVQLYRTVCSVQLGFLSV